jgi:hypothetical protein
MEEEAARIQPLNHGHHRTAKQPKLESPSKLCNFGHSVTIHRPLRGGGLLEDFVSRTSTK